jgi:hypothetical protein
MTSLSSSQPISKNLNIKTYNNIILPAVYMGMKCGTLTLRDEH